MSKYYEWQKFTKLVFQGSVVLCLLLVFFLGGISISNYLKIKRLPGSLSLLSDGENIIIYNTTSSSIHGYGWHAIDHIIGIKLVRNKIIGQIIALEKINLAKDDEIEVNIYEGCDGVCVLVVDPNVLSWSGEGELCKYGWNGVVLAKRRKTLSK